MMEPPGTDPRTRPPGEPLPRLRKRRSAPERGAVEPRIRPGLFVPWLQWIQDAAAPGGRRPGLLSHGHRRPGAEPSHRLLVRGTSTRVADPAPTSAPEPLASDPRPRGPAPPADPAPAGEPAAPGSWVLKPESAPSPRGLALAYAYRTRSPGGDSRFDWFVQIKGARSLLEEVDQVVWRMDPPPRNDGGDLVSRNRAQRRIPPVRRRTRRLVRRHRHRAVQGRQRGDALPPDRATRVVRAAALPPPPRGALRGLPRPRKIYRYFVGQMMVRHMCADGLPSKPRPSFGCLKWRPTTSVNSSRLTCALGSKE